MSTATAKATVALVQCSSYEETEITTALNRGFSLLGGSEQFFPKNKNVILKPNLLYGSEPEKAIITHPAIFKGCAQIALSHKAQVGYGDSSALNATKAGLKKSGYPEIARELTITHHNFEKAIEVSHPHGLITKRLTLSEPAVHCDILISLSKCKTHGLTLFTGAVKNQYGCVPGLTKGHYHAQHPNVYNFSKLVVDISTFLKPALYIMDAVVAMEGNGPGSGDPRPLNCILMSTDPVALDATACRIIGIPPEHVTTTQPGEESGLGVWQEEKIRVLGDSIESLKPANFNAATTPPIGVSTKGIRGMIKNLMTRRPHITRSKCIKCGKCIASCPVEPKAVNWNKNNRKQPPRYNYNRCIRCFCCHEICPEKAITIQTPLLGIFLPWLSYINLLLSRSMLRKIIKRK